MVHIMYMTVAFIFPPESLSQAGLMLAKCKQSKIQKCKMQKAGLTLAKCKKSKMQKCIMQNAKMKNAKKLD